MKDQKLGEIYFSKESIVFPEDVARKIVLAYNGKIPKKKRVLKKKLMKAFREEIVPYIREMSEKNG